MKVLLELFELLMVTGVGIGGGALLVKVFRKPAKAKHKCPWEPCGYPLPEQPLVERPETANTYAAYALEECQGCGNAIKYNGYLGRYERIKVSS